MNRLEFEKRVLRPVGQEQVEAAHARAADSPRARAILRYHAHEEPVQRMINAVEPQSYVRPHKHEEPDKHEVFIVLRGRAVICHWSDDGELLEHFEISADGPRYGVEIPPRVWHSLLTLEPGTALYEIIEGPFSPDSHKNYAEWAPEEGSDEGRAFLVELRAKLGLGPL